MLIKESVLRPEIFQIPISWPGKKKTQTELLCNDIYCHTYLHTVFILLEMK